ncbi:MAG: XdhC/CoxI family protein [Acidimicrobiia bacterium]|nr:XdhC/CoxI family protein [Acidimicrobiia bacterium]
MSAGDNAQVLRELAAALESGRSAALATVVQTRRSVPRRAGTKMLVLDDGRTVGTVGGGAMEAAVIAEALEAIRSGKSNLLEYDLLNPAEGDPGICGGEVKIYLEPYMPPHTVYVIGCGHVGSRVVDLAHWLGYRTIAVDDREDLVTEEALPDADVRFHGSVEAALAVHPITADSSIVVVTRSTDLDAAALPHVVDSPARYIGVMGSHTRWRTTSERLIAAGLPAESLGRVHSPIGIEVGAETLEEIAVSIMSEIIKVNRTVES